MIAVAGVSHEDLLLEKAVHLPILGVPIPQVQFFQFAPIFLLLFHLGLISQLVLLARKTLEFDSSVRQLEPTRRRTHPLRLELHNFFFVQGIAGPHRSAIMSLFLHSMSWLTLAILPVVLLLFIQMSFLPYHDAVITWTHRIALLLDIGVLILIGVFLTRAETSFFQAFWRTSISHPFSLLMTATVLTFVAIFSFVVGTIPGENLDIAVRKMFRLDAKQKAAHGGPAYLHGFTIPFLWGSADGSLFGFFHRNLIVTDIDLVVDKDVTPGERSLSLRGRDLRFAKLDRSDLHQADMTGVNLQGASLVGTDLSRVRLNCQDETELLLGEGRDKAKCASARNADFTGAKLVGAQMTGIDLSGAKLENTNLEGAILKFAFSKAAISGTPICARRTDGRHQGARCELSGGAARRRRSQWCAAAVCRFLQCPIAGRLAGARTFAGCGIARCRYDCGADDARALAWCGFDRHQPERCRHAVCLGVDDAAAQRGTTQTGRFLRFADQTAVEDRP